VGRNVTGNAFSVDQGGNAVTIAAKQLSTGTVGEMMTPGILTCTPGTALSAVAQMMAVHRVHAIVVFGRHESMLPWGVISDLDLVGAIDSGANAGAIAASPVITVTPDDTVLHAAHLMSEHSTAHLIVVADPASPLPIGVISSLDIVRAIAAGSAGTTSL
jgi:CBS domain-containing protein